MASKRTKPKPHRKSGSGDQFGGTGASYQTEMDARRSGAEQQSAMLNSMTDPDNELAVAIGSMLLGGADAFSQQAMQARQPRLPALAQEPMAPPAPRPVMLGGAERPIVDEETTSGMGWGWWPPGPRVRQQTTRTERGTRRYGGGSLRAME